MSGPQHYENDALPAKILATVQGHYLGKINADGCVREPVINIQTGWSLSRVAEQALSVAFFP